jgi:hypothetical protein
MVRFMLCTQVVLTLAAVHLLSRSGVTGTRSWARILLACLVLVSLAVQLLLAQRFTHGLWVAENHLPRMLSTARLIVSTPVWMLGRGTG